MTEELFAKFVRRLTGAFLLMLLVMLVVGRVRAQNSGVVGIATKEIPVFTAQGTTLSSGGSWQCNGSTTPIPCPVLPDIGAGCQSLNYQTSGFVGMIDLEWSIVASPYTAIPLVQASYSAADTSTSHVLQLGGYYPNLRATVTPTLGTLNAQYTASATGCSFVPTGVGSNGPTAPINCDLSYVFSNGTGTTAAIVTPINAGDTIIICGLTVSFAGATSSGLFAVAWATTTGCSSLSGPSWEIVTESNTPQIVIDPVAQRAPNSGRSVACVSNSSGVSVTVAISYASVHGL